MIDEFMVFETSLSRLSDFLRKNNYLFDSSLSLSGNPAVNYTYKNALINKSISIRFSPSYGSIIQNRITVVISNLANNQAIDLSTLLAYSKKEGRVNWQEQSKYFYRIDPENLSESIDKSLEEIINVLNNEAKIIFSTNAWYVIPIHDPRDDY